MIRQLIGLALLSALASAAAAQSPAKPAQPAPAAVKPDIVLQKWTGDLDGMIKRRRIRVLVSYSKTQYFIDKGQPRGIAYEAFNVFEDELNKKLKTGNLRVHVVFVPVSRDELIPALVDGRGDVVSAALAITPERQKVVDFATPTYTSVADIVVTGPKSPKIAALDDLAGQEVYVRPSSAYHQSLVRLNADFKKRGKAPIVLKPAPDNLEDEDLLEMLNAGLVKAIVVHSHIASFWKNVFPT